LAAGWVATGRLVAWEAGMSSPGAASWEAGS